MDMTYRRDRMEDIVYDDSNPPVIKNNGTKVMNGWIIGLMILATVGIVVYEISLNSEMIEYGEDNAGGLIGRIAIEIGLMVSAILLIKTGLSTDGKRDSTIKFGCLLVGGVLIAFTLITFL